MANIILSPNMSLPVPVVGVDPGPDYATNVNNSLTIIDTHDHSAGKGLSITPSGINLNTDLPFLNNNAISLKSVRFTPQSSALVSPSDIGCLYEIGVDLYYNDGSGNTIRITQGGSIVGTSGSIANLVSPASVTFVSGIETYIFQADTNKPGNIDAGYFIFRNNTVGSFGLSLFPPNAMASDISMTLPALPAQTNLVTLDPSGNFAAVTNVDNTTIEIASNLLKVKNNSIGPTQLAPLNYAISALSGNYIMPGSSTDYLITNQTVTITTNGRPVQLGIQFPSDGVSQTQFAVSNSGGVILKWKRNGTEIFSSAVLAPGGQYASVSNGSVSYVDFPPSAGTYTYTLWAFGSAGPFASGLTISGGLGIQSLVYEL